MENSKDINSTPYNQIVRTNMSDAHEENVDAGLSLMLPSADADEQTKRVEDINNKFLNYRANLERNREDHEYIQLERRKFNVSLTNIIQDVKELRNDVNRFKKDYSWEEVETLQIPTIEGGGDGHQRTLSLDSQKRLSGAEDGSRKMIKPKGVKQYAQNVAAGKNDNPDNTEKIECLKESEKEGTFQDAEKCVLC